jgi:hypothetical protein
LVAVIDRYNYGEIPKQIQALKLYQDFRGRAGFFGSARMKTMATTESANDFWKLSTLFATEGSELFRKLVDGYAGQGESERKNKMVKNSRPTDRNRESHIVTSSYMEFYILYKMIQKSEDAAKMTDINAPYIDSLRDVIAELEAEREQGRGQEPEAVFGGEEEEEINDDDEFDDLEYALDPPVEGRVNKHRFDGSETPFYALIPVYSGVHYHHTYRVPTVRNLLAM